MIVQLPEKSDRQNPQAGFSLVELIIVVVIMGILAGYVTYNLSTDSTQLKTYVFNTKAQFHKAKFEAIKRNRNVYIDFDFNPPAGTIDNGYTIWVDENFDGAYLLADDGPLIDTIVFQNGVAIYDNIPVRTDEPGATVGGPAGSTIGEGVSANNFRFIMRPNGRCSSAGTVYIYLPISATDNTISAGPWAIITSTVGRIRIDEWKSSGWVVN